MNTVIYLVRHAEAEGNIKNIFHGWTDSVITQKGRLQASKMAQKFADIPLDVIYSSSLKRTIQTAEYIAALKNIPIILREGLREINGGDWECRNWDDVIKGWPDEFETWQNMPHNHKMPNGETMEGFQKRLIKEVQNICKLNKGKSICIVTHGTAIRILLSWFKCTNLVEMKNIKLQDNTAISKITYIDDRFEIITEGENCHLSDNLSTILGEFK